MQVDGGAIPSLSLQILAVTRVSSPSVAACSPKLPTFFVGSIRARVRRATPSGPSYRLHRSTFTEAARGNPRWLSSFLG